MYANRIQKYLQIEGGLSFMKTYNQLFSLAPIFQSGMVLQREKEIKIWGTALPGSLVSITLGFQMGEAITFENGTFLVTLQPLSAAQGLTLIAENDRPDTRPIEMHSISIGDVWLACGQSNMEFFLRYDQDWEEVKNLPKNPQIHMYNVPQVAFEGHTSHNKGGYGYWLQEGDNGFDMFSAPGYSFARNLQPAIDVPIGIISCNWGGTTASAWVPESVLEEAPLNTYLQEYEDAIKDIDPEELRTESLKAWTFEDSLQHGKDFEPLLYGRDRSWQIDYMKQHAGEPVIPMGPYNINRPSGLYYTMLQELIPFSIKGVLWYQGESDAGNRASMYDKLLSSLILDWRKEWQDDFPFLFVQLAPFGRWLECGNEEYTEVRAKQQLVADTVPCAYMASIMDIGSYHDIHPKAKMEVGRRLALLARGHVYGEKDLLCDSPRLSRISCDDCGLLSLSFTSGEGLTIEDGPSDLICETPNGIITPVRVSVSDDRLLIQLPSEVIDQHLLLTVSLGWGDFAQIFIRNKQGLPIAPFRTQIQL